MPNLAALARDKGMAKGRTVRIRPAVPTQALANDLYAIYADSIAIWQELASQLSAAYTRPAPITSDADGAQLSWLVTQAAQRADQTILYQTERLGRWVSRVGAWHGARTISAIKSATGVDIEPFIRLSDVRGLLDDSIRANVSLIRDLNADTRSRMEAIILDSLVNRRTKKETTDAIAKAMGITKRRARRIANDQAHKLGISLSAYRNQQLGIKTYLWETMRDDRVRNLHKRRQGKTFRWDKPPVDGHPGYAPGCRCHALPVLET